LLFINSAAVAVLSSAGACEVGQGRSSTTLVVTGGNLLLGNGTGAIFLPEIGGGGGNLNIKYLNIFSINKKPFDFLSLAHMKDSGLKHCGERAEEVFAPIHLY
jgi:hypothetical protein